MSFNISAVTGYVKANEKNLVAKSVIGGRTLGLIKFHPEIKGSAQLNLLSAAATLQAGGCGWSAAGTTTMTKRNLVTGLFKVNQALCEKDLVGTFAEWGLNEAVGKTTLTFEQEIANANVKSIEKQVELLAWNGDTTGSSSTYLDVADGFIKILANASGVIAAKVTGTTLAANTIAAIDKIVAAIPNEIIDADDLTVFVGYEIFRKYVADYNASNLYAGTLTFDGNMTLVIPNTNIKLQGVAGLTGKNKAYASTASNFVAGGDIQGAESIFELFYANEAREYRLVVEFNLGFQVYFPDFVVSYID